MTSLLQAAWSIESEILQSRSASAGFDEHALVLAKRAEEFHIRTLRQES